MTGIKKHRPRAMNGVERCYRLFGKHVEKYRTAGGLTQEQVAKRVGLTRSSIVNIEHGRQRVLLDDVSKFAKALRVKPINLLRGIVW